MMILSDNNATIPPSILSFYKRIKDIGSTPNAKELSSLRRCPGTYHKTHIQKIKLVSNCFLDVLDGMNVREIITTPVRKLCFNNAPSDPSLVSNASSCMRPEGSYETHQNVKKVCFTEFVEIQFLHDFKKHVRFAENHMVRIIPARD